jgi:hypothetical protein
MIGTVLVLKKEKVVAVRSRRRRMDWKVGRHHLNSRIEEVTKQDRNWLSCTLKKINMTLILMVVMGKER